MRIELPDSGTGQISSTLRNLRAQTGAMTLGRVMTLVINTTEPEVEDALAAAVKATRAHPSRIIALVPSDRRRAARMDATVSMGEAGGGEVVVARLHGELADHPDAVVTPLLIADSPVVAWWPRTAPTDLGNDPIGAMAGRRITDAALAARPRAELLRRRDSFAAGDRDLAWARTTRWRALLATALDQPPYEPVTDVEVHGASDSASTDLLCGWLAVRLRVPVRRVRGARGTGLTCVRMQRSSGPIELVRPDRRFARVTQPGQPCRTVDLTRPDAAASLAEELHSTDRDPTYRDALCNGLALVDGIEGAS